MWTSMGIPLKTITAIIRGFVYSKRQKLSNSVRIGYKHSRFWRRDEMISNFIYISNKFIWFLSSFKKAVYWYIVYKYWERHYVESVFVCTQQSGLFVWWQSLLQLWATVGVSGGGACDVEVSGLTCEHLKTVEDGTKYSIQWQQWKRRRSRRLWSGWEVCREQRRNGRQWRRWHRSEGQRSRNDSGRWWCKSWSVWRSGCRKKRV